MKRRTLGRGGASVSAIGLGCWGMSGSYGEADEVEAMRTLHRALDLGVNFLDTADSYGDDGHNESLIGRALDHRRGESFLATKTGIVRRTGPDGRTIVEVDGRPDRIRLACESSLSRLRTDVIDLYYLHRVDANVPIEESVGAMAELVTAGKVRQLGLSEVAPQTLRRAHAVHPIKAVQSEYSLWTRDAEAEIIPLCAELGVAFVPFSPLGRGFLTGTLTDAANLAPGDWRVTNERFSPVNLGRNVSLLAILQRMAQELSCTSGQIALSWVLSRGEHVIPIPGTKRMQNLEENVGCVEVDLTEAHLATLDAAFPPGVAVGQRYSPEQARWLGR